MDNKELALQIEELEERIAPTRRCGGHDGSGSGSGKSGSDGSHSRSGKSGSDGSHSGSGKSGS